MRENDHGQNPTADGYVFHCWVTTLDFEPDEAAMSNTAYYDGSPIYKDIILYAVWYKLVDEIEPKFGYQFARIRKKNHNRKSVSRLP